MGEQGPRGSLAGAPLELHFGKIELVGTCASHTDFCAVRFEKLTKMIKIGPVGKCGLAMPLREADVLAACERPPSLGRRSVALSLKQHCRR